MRNPGLVLWTTILNWLAFGFWLYKEVAYPSPIYSSAPVTFTGIVLALLFASALLQTLFFLRNIQVTFHVADKNKAYEKPKKRPRERLSEWVHTLDEDERAQLFHMMTEQGEDETRAR